MDHFYNQPHMGENWFTFASLYKYVVDTAQNDSKFVEIGSWKGMSAAFMGVEIINSGKNLKLDCIDSWNDAGFAEQYHGQDILPIFLNNIEPVSNVITAIKCDSVEASARYEDASLDFVFVDGDHSYAGVKRDIIAYLPKMKPNSIFAGHDYGWTPEIRRAVGELFGEGDHSDPWGCGCFIFRIVDGKPIKFIP